MEVNAFANAVVQAFKIYKGNNNIRIVTNIVLTPCGGIIRN